MNKDRIPHKMKIKWQGITNLVSKLLDTPSTLIMCTKDEFLEVFISSQSKNNPFKPGDIEKWQEQYTITDKKSKRNCFVASAGPKRDTDPDIRHENKAFLGYPLKFNDTSTFGALCIFDNKDKVLKDETKELLYYFKEIIESDLFYFFDKEIKTSERYQVIKHDFQNGLRNNSKEQRFNIDNVSNCSPAIAWALPFEIFWEAEHEKGRTCR